MPLTRAHKDARVRHEHTSLITPKHMQRTHIFAIGVEIRALLFDDKNSRSQCKEFVNFSTAEVIKGLHFK